MSTSGTSGSSEPRASPATRTEADAFGEILVEDTRYWGAQTQRSLMNFPIGGRESRMPIEVIKGVHRLGSLDFKRAAVYSRRMRRLYETVVLPPDAAPQLGGACVCALAEGIMILVSSVRIRETGPQPERLRCVVKINALLQQRGSQQGVCRSFRTAE